MRYMKRGHDLFWNELLLIVTYEYGEISRKKSFFLFQFVFREIMFWGWRKIAVGIRGLFEKMFFFGGGGKCLGKKRILTICFLSALE